MDKLLEHALGHLVVGDDALAQGADGNDVAGGTAEHGLRLSADLQELAGILVDGDDRGLVEHDALALYINQDRGGTQVDADILC